MVNFRDLRISPDGKELLIDAVVAPYTYFENMYISQVVIDTEETFNINGPSTKPFYKQDITSQEKELALDLTADALDIDSFTGHIYYVYVYVDGTPNGQTPCGWDNEFTLGVVLDWKPIYQQGINVMKRTVDNCCSMNKELIDYILRFESFELALRTGQYPLANEKFNQWYKDARVISMSSRITSTCNCQ